MLMLGARHVSAPDLPQRRATDQALAGEYVSLLIERDLGYQILVIIRR